MKLNKLWASVLALLALASCSKDLEPSANTVEPAQPVAEYQLVRMDIKATQDDNALRVGYGVSDDESGVLTGLALADKNVNIRIAVKQGLNGTPVVDTYPFTKIGRASFAFSDKIKIPVKSGDEPYYMAAVLVSEGTKGQAGYLEYATVKTPTSTNVQIADRRLLQPDAEHKIYPNIPYRSQWQQVEMNAVGTEGKVANHTTIKLKPLGTLLRFRIHNMTSAPKNVHRIMFSSPTFVNSGEIDFLQTDKDNFPKAHLAQATALLYNLVPQITLAADQQSNWYYVWAKSYDYTNDIRPQTTLAYYSPGSSVEYVETPIFKSKQLLRDGSMNVIFKIRDGVDAELEDLEDAGSLETADVLYDWPGTVLRRLSTGVVNTAGDGFVSVADNNVNVQDPSVRYISFADAVKEFKKPVKIAVNGGNKKYSLPTANELKSIFPAPVWPLTHLLVRSNMDRTLENVLEQDITINGETKDFRGDYKNVASKKATYAIRFKDASNKHRTAFKYTLEEVGGNRFFKVQARPLGNKPEFSSVTLASLEQDSFWSHSSVDKRIFPFYGGKFTLGSSTTATRNNEMGVSWSSDRNTAESVYVLSSTSLWEQYAFTGSIPITASEGVREYPIFLFERK